MPPCRQVLTTVKSVFRTSLYRKVCWNIQRISTVNEHMFSIMQSNTGNCNPDASGLRINLVSRYSIQYSHTRYMAFAVWSNISALFPLRLKFYFIKVFFLLFFFRTVSHLNYKTPQQPYYKITFFEVTNIKVLLILCFSVCCCIGLHFIVKCFSRFVHSSIEYKLHKVSIYWRFVLLDCIILYSCNYVIMSTPCLRNDAT